MSSVSTRQSGRPTSTIEGAGGCMHCRHDSATGSSKTWMPFQRRGYQKLAVHGQLTL